MSAAKVFYFCNGNVKTLGIENIWIFADFRPVHCASKNPISPKVFNRFSKSLPQLENTLGWAFVWKVSGALRYFTFAMERRKLCASTTFEILPLSTCTLWQQKSYISKGIQMIFEIFAWARRCWEVCILVESFKCAGCFTFEMARWKLWASTTFEFLPLSTCTLYTVAAKFLYLQKYSTEYSKSLPQLEDVEGVHLGGKSSRARVVYSCNGKMKTLSHRQNLNFCHFQPVHCASKNPIFPKVFKRSSKSLPELEDVEGGHLGGKCSGAQVFYCCNGKVKSLRLDNICNFCRLSSCTLWQPKSCISKSIQYRFSKSLPQVENLWGSAFGWKVSCAQVFHFCNCKAKTLRMDNIWNFATNNLYTVAAKILHHQKYSTDFRNLRLSSKMLRVGIWVECFRCGGILLLQWQGENSAHRQHLKFCGFQHVHCALWLQNPISRKSIQPNFRNLCLSSKILRVGIWVESLHVRRYFTFAIARRKLCVIDNIWNSAAFNLLHCASKNPYTSKSIQPIFEIFPSARRCWWWAFGWKVSGAQVFYFCNGKVKSLRLDNICNFADFNLYTVPAKILYLEKYSTDFRNLCLRSKILRVGIWVESFMCAGISLLQLQGENFAHRQHLKFCH